FSLNLSPYFFLYQSPAPLALHSFPTRRSSDLPSASEFAPRDGVRRTSRSTESRPLLLLRRHDHVREELSRQPGRGSAIRRSLHRDRKSTRLNSSHVSISYAVFCLKKKKKTREH